MDLRQKLSLMADWAKYRLLPNSKSGRSGTLTVRCDRIGDFALYAPFVRAGFRKGERNVLLCNALWKELAARLFPEAEIWSVEPKKFLEDARYRQELLNRVRAGNFRRVLQPRFYRELLVEELLFCASGAPECLRFEATQGHLQYPLLKQLPRNAEEIPYRTREHELERNARFAATLGAKEFINPWLAKPFKAPPEFRDKGYICLFPGSGKGSFCSWPPERWAELILHLDLKNILVTGSSGEKEICSRIAELLPGRATVLAGTLELPSWAGLVSHARFVMGNDTGGIHVAAMSGVPSFAVCGRGQPGWFLPYPASNPVPGVAAPVVVTEPCPCENCFWRCDKLTDGICTCIHAVTVDAAESGFRSSSFSALR